MEPQEVKFIVTKDDFSSALSWIARSLPAKPTQPVLRGILINAEDDTLELSGFDRETSNKIRINAQVDVPGRMLVAGKLSSEIVATLPDKPIIVEYDGTKVLVKAGTSRFELPAMTIEDYPVLPGMPAVTGTIDPTLFTEVVQQVAVAAGKDETLPMLTGVNMEINGEEITVAATDRYRLALRTFNWNPATADAQASLLIPAKTLAEVARSVDSHYTDPIEIAAGTGEEIGTDGLLGVATDTRQTTTRLLDAKFPPVRPLLPTTHNAIATVEAAPLNEAIRRVALMSDRNSQVRLEFSEGQVTLSASGSEGGTATETLPCAFAGEPLTTAFNPGYLRDGLSVIHTQRVFFGFTDAARPAILLPEPKEIPERNADGVFPTPATEFTFLLMPVRLPG